MCVLVLLVLLCANTASGGRINIDNTAHDVVCGDSVTFTWSYEDDGDPVPAGTTLNFSFREDKIFGGTDLIVANIGQTILVSRIAADAKIANN